MSLTIKVGTKCFDRFFCWKYQLKMPFSSLFFFIFCHYLEIVFCEMIEAVQKRRYHAFFLVVFQCILFIRRRGLCWMLGFCWWSRRLILLKLQLRFGIWILCFLCITFYRIKPKKPVFVLLLFIILDSLAVKYLKANQMESITQQHCFHLLVIWTWAGKRWCDVYF